MDSCIGKRFGREGGGEAGQGEEERVRKAWKAECVRGGEQYGGGAERDSRGHGEMERRFGDGGRRSAAGLAVTRAGARRMGGGGERNA